MMVVVTFSFLSEAAVEAQVQPKSIQVLVDGSNRIATVGDEFICATLDWWPASKCDYGSCPWYNASLLNLVIYRLHRHEFTHLYMVVAALSTLCTSNVNELFSWKIYFILLCQFLINRRS